MPRLSKFHQSRIDSALQQKLRVLVNIVLIHTATRMSGFLVALVQLIVLGKEAQTQDVGLQVLMACLCPQLAAVRQELISNDAQWLAGLAAIAIWAVSEHATAPESLVHQVRINGILNKVAGRRYLRACHPVWQVAAGVGRRSVVLQRVQWQVIELRHALFQRDSNCDQYTDSKNH